MSGEAPRRAAVITGAARRVGAAVAEELAAAGYDLLLHHRGPPAEMDTIVRACAAHGASVGLVSADLGTVDGARAVVAAAADLPRVDVLVNNASVFRPVPFEQIDVEAWDHMQAVNLRAPFLLAQGLLPQLRAAGGLVVHLCDIGADRPVSGYAHYSVSKAGLVMLVKAMAVELAPAVRTVGVSPGHVVWPEAWDDEERDRQARRIPLGRVGHPDDVARLVRFLALEGTYINGDVIAVDGGRACRY
jgi:pteridine reductase